ncbi:MAG: arginine--tRNA ligase [Planctomycetota bacterium]
MSSLLHTLETAFTDAIAQVCAEVSGFDRCEINAAVAPSANPKFGDYQCNAAMGLAKKLGRKPRDIAQDIVDKFAACAMVEKLEIAGPGFINVTLSPVWIAGQLNHAGEVAPAGPKQTVVVEYSSPNIAKQMHIGHLRGTILGDAIARIMRALGHNVIRQNHVGDWGTPFGMLIAHLREVEADAEAGIGDLDQFYRDSKQRFDEDPAFADTARAAVVALQRGDQPERAAWQRLVDETRKHYLAVYKRLGVELTVDHERGESFYNEWLRPMVDELLEAGVVEKSDGATVSFQGGYKAPLMVEKSGGGFGYGTTDLAAAEYRAKQLKADRILYFVDYRQSQHFAQVFATVKAAGWIPDGVSLEHAAYGTIMGDDNKPLKTRSGDNVKLGDVLEEAVRRAKELVDDKSSKLPSEERVAIAEAVGIGAVKYFDMARDRTSDYVFDWDAMLSLNGNTAPYLQYAYCRCRGIFRKGGVDFETFTPQLHELEPNHELPLAKHILRFPEVVELVARELKPHHLCTYLYELACMFSGFFENNPVLGSDEQTHRLSLCHAMGQTLATGLGLLGIEHPERM